MGHQIEAWKSLVTYQQEHKEAVNAYHRNYYKTHKYVETRQQYYESNRAEYAERNHKWYEIAENKIRRLEKIHGISFKEVWEYQNGLCPICTLPLDEDVHVDHNHKTMIVRGILHRACNTGLGSFKDSVDVLQNAINYLQSNTNFGTSKYKVKGKEGL